MDKNGDGKLEKHEMIQTLFEQIDEDLNGQISIPEFAGLLEDYAEFLGLKMRDGWKKEFKAAFDEFHSMNGDTHIPISDLLDFFQENGVEINSFTDAIAFYSLDPKTGEIEVDGKEISDADDVEDADKGEDTSDDESSESEDEEEGEEKEDKKEEKEDDSDDSLNGESALGRNYFENLKRKSMSNIR